MAAVVAAAAILAVMLTRQFDAPSSEDRVAFFGFRAEDASVTDVARLATDETYDGLQVYGAPTVARSDAEAPYSGLRLDRAKDLEAAYALSGEVRRDPRTNGVSISVRIEEVATRTILFEQNFQGEAALPVAIEAASMLIRGAACLSFVRQRKGAPPGRDWIPAAAATCTTPRGDMDSVRALRELARAAPDMASAHAGLALMLGYNSPTVAGAARSGMIADAKAALARAEALDRGDFMAVAARYLLGTIDDRPLIDLEADLKRWMQRQPQAWERYTYQSASLFYGSFLQRTGRIRDSALSFRASADSSPFDTGPVYNYAHALALIGNGEAQDRFTQAFARFPAPYVWEQSVRSALFLGIGDAEALLASPPPPISAAMAQCWRDMREAINSQQEPARAAGAERTKACRSSGLITLASALSVLSALGDLDGAFALASAPDAYTPRDTPAPLFWPPTRAMRADPRFLPLVESLGLMDYWKASGTKPDVCETEKAPFCEALN